MRRAPQLGQKPRFLHEKATSFSWAQPAQRRRERAMSKEAAFKKGLELRLDKLWQGRSSLGLDLGQEGVEVLLDQLVEDGVFRTPPCVMDALCRLRRLNRLAHDPFRCFVTD